MESTLIEFVVGLVILVVVIYRTRTGQGGAKTVAGAIDKFYATTRLVETYAAAADQLLSIGAIAKEDRLEYVIDMVMSYTDELDSKQIRGIVEAWVAERKADG